MASSWVSEFSHKSRVLTRHLSIKAKRRNSLSFWGNLSGARDLACEERIKSVISRYTRVYNLCNLSFSIKV